VTVAPTVQLPKVAEPKKEASETAGLYAERDRLQAELQESNRLVQESVSRAEKNLKETTDLRAAETSLEESERRLSQLNSTQAESIQALSAQKATLQQQLENTRAMLQKANQDLDNARQDREHALFRTASLETEMRTLNGRLRVMEDAAKQQDQFLASDRDIRELMGARQLYIADVFDVNQDGKNSKAFGRVFYTKAKSLIFYAFDLDRQPGVREAKAFQAWGRTDAERSNPVSLGIFYEDNVANKRWVLKSDNSDVLEQISSVFVTVEPAGGSKKPSGKPFLLAYLRSLPPNHP